MYWRFDGNGNWMMGNWLGMVFICLIVIIIIIVIITMIFSMRRSGYMHMKHMGMGEEDSAMKILNERYAKGEITEDEYKKMKENLKM